MLLVYENCRNLLDPRNEMIHFLSSWSNIKKMHFMFYCSYFAKLLSVWGVTIEFLFVNVSI
jgi:hypothetical protein